MSSPRSRPPVTWAGPRAFLIECSSLSDVMRLHAHLRAHPYQGQLEAIAAAATVLLCFAAPEEARAAAGDVVILAAADAESAPGKTVTIDVVYDGEDLAEVGELTGLGERGVLEAHTRAAWTVAFGGFAPGFGYAVADGDPLVVPRRDTPRTAVPQGSVALAGRFSAVYPQRSPGGWQLIGHTSARLWDLERPDPALLSPGDTVRYRAVRERAHLTPGTPATPGPGGIPRPGATPHAALPDHAVPLSDAAPLEPGDTVHAVIVQDPGMQCLVQDRGRPGHGDLGVSGSGAADRPSAGQVNRLVGNTADAAVLESLLGGLSLRARGHHVLALGGAEVSAGISSPHGERCAPARAPFALFDGETLTLGAPRAGLRSYVAVRGGLATPEILGSRATDTLAGIEPQHVTAGTILPVPAVPTGRAVGVPEPPATIVPEPGRAVTLRIAPGPRADWFTPSALDVLTERQWRVGTDSNRVGVRFEAPEDGAVLQRSKDGELASEGVVTGSLQVPHSGVPVLFLADHPVTGGYPVIAVVVPDDVPVAAQLPPGTLVQFRPVGAPTTGPDTPSSPSETDPPGEQA